MLKKNIFIISVLSVFISTANAKNVDIYTKELPFTVIYFYIIEDFLRFF